MFNKETAALLSPCVLDMRLCLAILVWSRCLSVDSGGAEGHIPRDFSPASVVYLVCTSCHMPTSCLQLVAPMCGPKKRSGNAIYVCLLCLLSSGYLPLIDPRDCCVENEAIDEPSLTHVVYSCCTQMMHSIPLSLLAPVAPRVTIEYIRTSRNY